MGAKHLCNYVSEFPGKSNGKLDYTSQCYKLVSSEFPVSAGAGALHGKEKMEKEKEDQEKQEKEEQEKTVKHTSVKEADKTSCTGRRPSRSALSSRNDRKSAKSPQRTDAPKENKHPFALYGWGERQTDTGSQKTHNVCASASVNEIHESALRAKNRRQVEKRKLSQRRVRSAEAENTWRTKPSPPDNPWMTETAAQKRRPKLALADTDSCPQTGNSEYYRPATRWTHPALRLTPSDVFLPVEVRHPC
ncbi:hypothetical protein DV515_00010677 [Chloebia gouldiae]|uniref:Uncharacterized protein n=1 Tax=Chloebia gouldiae TaxID=44316 RepID=A0A3L8S9M4_CHLGU|nr:hypothetical protein DV515_00010677 [Chloebia gouldiae]